MCHLCIHVVHIAVELALPIMRRTAQHIQPHVLIHAQHIQPHVLIHAQHGQLHVTQHVLLTTQLHIHVML